MVGGVRKIEDIFFLNNGFSHTVSLLRYVFSTGMVYFYYFCHFCCNSARLPAELRLETVSSSTGSERSRRHALFEFVRIVYLPFTPHLLPKASDHPFPRVGNLCGDVISLIIDNGCWLASEHRADCSADDDAQ